MNSSSSSDVSNNSSEMQQPLLIVTGPTAAGKTSLAIELARALAGEVVNADSVQVYHGFRIAAGQPSAEEFAQVPHHLFDCFDPREPLDVWRYVEEADRIIAMIRSRGAVPVVSGGTGLYIQSLLHGLSDIPEVPDAVVEAIRAEVIRLRQKGLEHLAAHLQQRDPQAAAILSLSDTQRIVRALSVREYSGTSLFDLRQGFSGRAPRHAALVVVLLPPREQIYESINARVDQMWEKGLLDEFKGLRERYGSQVRALQSIGYAQAAKCVEGLYEEEQARAEMKRDTRRFAKRQLTWWRNQPRKLAWDILEAQPSGGVAEIAKYYSSLVDSLRETAKPQIAMLPLGTLY